MLGEELETLFRLGGELGACSETGLGDKLFEADKLLAKWGVCFN